MVNKREDGYHNIHSLFIEIDLADELIFVPANKFSLNVECENNIQMPNADENLIENMGLADSAVFPSTFSKSCFINKILLFMNIMM